MVVSVILLLNTFGLCVELRFMSLLFQGYYATAIFVPTKMTLVPRTGIASHLPLCKKTPELLRMHTGG
jgi:hypothetical protein